MHKVYCDICGILEKNKDFIFYTRTEIGRWGHLIKKEYEVCPKCDKEIKEEFENGKNETKSNDKE